MCQLRKLHIHRDLQAFNRLPPKMWILDTEMWILDREMWILGKDDKELIGHIMNMRDPDYWININMMTPSTVTKIKIADVTSIEPSPISMIQRIVV
jgi:hypothetical protein